MYSYQERKNQYSKLNFQEHESIFNTHPLHFRILTGKTINETSLIPNNSIIPKVNSGNPFLKSIGLSTTLHCALLLNPEDFPNTEFINHKFRLALTIMQNDCSSIINMLNQDNNSALMLISKWPNNEQLMELAELAIQHGALIEQVDLTCSLKTLNLPIINFFIDKGINLNTLIGHTKDETIFEYIFSKVIYAKTDLPLINQLLTLLLDSGADPALSGKSGKTLAELIHFHPLHDHIDPQISRRVNLPLNPDTLKDTLKTIEKRREIFHATHHLISPTSNNFFVHDKSLCLLIEHKKRNRRLKGDDFECTILNGVKQFEEFLQLIKLRINIGEAFHTQFLIRANEYTIHISTGQILVDEHGVVTLFWADTIGHSPEAKQIIADATHHIGNLVITAFPTASLYTIDERIQSTDTGCHIFSLYIAEQLSIAYKKTESIQNDLLRIWEERQIEYRGFRIIPFNQCPAYTGIPRIVQSASRPEARINLNQEMDLRILNQKQQNYPEAIRAHQVEINGKLQNSMFNHKRIKNGNKLQDIMEAHSTDEFNRLSINAAIDIINHVPEHAILQDSTINIQFRKPDLWAIHIELPALNNYIETLYIRATNKTKFLKTIKDKRYDLFYPNHHISNIQLNTCSLFQYAALTALINTLEADNTAQLNLYTDDGYKESTLDRICI